MIISENAERRFVVGFNGDKPAILWSDVDDFNEFSTHRGERVSFSEDGVQYGYLKTDQSKYVEVMGRAPAVDSFELLDSAELKKRGYDRVFSVRVIKPEKKRQYNHEYENPDLYEPKYGSPCGGMSGCGASSPDWYERRMSCGGHCGSFGNYYRKPCGGGYYRCGGGC